VKGIAPSFWLHSGSLCTYPNVYISSNCHSSSNGRREPGVQNRNSLVLIHLKQFKGSCMGSQSCKRTNAVSKLHRSGLPSWIFFRVCSYEWESTLTRDVESGAKNSAQISWARFGTSLDWSLFRSWTASQNLESRYKFFSCETCSRNRKHSIGDNMQCSRTTVKPQYYNRYSKI